MKDELTIEFLKELPPDCIFAYGYTEIEHPWFNDAKVSLIEGTHNTKIKWLAIRGFYHDWAIYHSLDANLEKADYLDGVSHLESSHEQIANWGAKLHDEAKIRELVPCTDEAFKMYRH